MSITVSIVSHGDSIKTKSLLVKVVTQCLLAKRFIVTINKNDGACALLTGMESDNVGILRQARPRGFARNHNEAHAYCDTEWFAVLNPDIDFDGDPFAALLEHARPEDGILAPVLVDRSGRASQDRGPISLMEIVRRRLPGWSAPPSPGWVPGAFMLIRSRAFQEVGGFDGAFRLYCEDADLCERMALAGYAIRRIQDVRVAHEGNRLSHRSARALMWHLRSLRRLLGKPSHQEFVRRWIRQQVAPNNAAASHEC